MGNSVLVFISHSSEDKEGYIEPVVADLEACFINIWIDKRKIVPGDNLRKSIFRDGLDKADVALIFFTEKSLKSSWVDREIKHVLREEAKKGNQFDLNKIIAVFDSKVAYDKIAERYPELTDELMHLMPPEYDKIQLGQLISAIWSKYLDLQGGDIKIQRQLLEKEKEIFQREKDIAKLSKELDQLKQKSSQNEQDAEFEEAFESGRLNDFIKAKKQLLENQWVSTIGKSSDFNRGEARAFGFVDIRIDKDISLTLRGREFFRWYILNKEK